MEKYFVEKWEANKHTMREWFENLESGVHYSGIVSKLFKVCYPEYDYKNITEINDGDWQGTQLYFIHKDTYQPCTSDYVFTSNYYGSCSGCDTILAINYSWDCSWRSEDEEPLRPKKEDVDDYMMVALHLVQSIKYLVPDND